MTTPATPGQPPAAPAAPASTAGAPLAGTEHPAPAAPWSGIEGIYTLGEGEAAKPWWSGIPEEPVRQYMEAKQYATPDDAARAAWNANQINKLSPEVTAVLEGKATPEQEAAFYNKLGRPESADKYEFKQPEGLAVDENLLKFGKELFFDAGLSPAKAQAAMEKWNKFAQEATTQTIEQQRVANDAALAELTTKWGAELNANRAAGERVMKSLDLDPVFMEKIESAVGSAAVVELLAKIGRASDEGQFKGPGTTSGNPNDPAHMSPEQAQARISALRSDPAFEKSYTTKDDPGHAQAVQTMMALFAKATPPKKN